MTSKEYYEKLECIVRQSKLAYRKRVVFCLHIWICKLLLILCRTSKTKTMEDNRRMLENLILYCKSVPFMTEVVSPFLEAMRLICEYRNLGNVLEHFTEEHASPNIPITHSQVFDILIEFPREHLTKILSQIYPEHYEQLVAYLEAGDKIHFVNYISTERLDMKRVENLCSYNISQYKLREYTGSLTAKEWNQFFAEVHSLVAAGEIEVSPECLKLIDAYKNPHTYLTSNGWQDLFEQYKELYRIMIVRYLIHKEQLNPIEQRTLECLMKKPRYIQFYNTVYEEYERVHADHPELIKQIIEKEQAQPLKSAQPLKKTSGKTIPVNQMPKSPEKVNIKQIPQIADELIKLKLINEDDREKFIYFLHGPADEIEGKYNIRWNDQYYSLKYLFKPLLYRELPDGSSRIITRIFSFKQGSEYGPVQYNTFGNCSMDKLAKAIDTGKKEQLEKIVTCQDKQKPSEQTCQSFD